MAWSGGAYDLVQRVADGGMYADYIRQVFPGGESAWKDASPVTHAADTKPLPPYLFIYLAPNTSSHLASERLAGLIRDAGGKAETKLIENRTHMGAIHHMGGPGDETGRILLDFIKQNGGD